MDNEGSDESDGKDDTDEVDDDDDDEDTEVEDHFVEETKVEKYRTVAQSEHYNSLVTHVMHQRAFTTNEIEEVL